MPVQVNCPQCSQMLRVPDAALGKSVRCPKCQTVFPANATPTPPAPANDPFNFNSASAAPPKNDPFNFQPASSAPPKNDPFGFPPPKSTPANDPFAGFGAPPPISGKPLNPAAINPYAAPQTQFTTDTGSGLPWETRGASFESYIATVKLIMFEPTNAFTTMRRTGDISSSITFAAAGLVIGAVGSLLWSVPLQLLMVANQGGGEAMAGVLIGSVFGLGAGIVGGMISLFIGAVITHVCLLICGAGNRGMETTIRVMAWCAGAFAWLNVVPFYLGTMIAVIWQFIAQVIGLATAHQSSIGKVLLAVFLPMIVCFGLAIVLIVMLGATAALNQ